MLTTSARRRLCAALLLPFILLLAGCGRLSADFEIQDVDTINLALDIAVTEDAGAELGYTSAEELCAASEDEEDIFGEVEPTPYEEDGYWGCRGEGVIERADFGSDIELTEEDGIFHLVMDVGDGTALSESDFELLGLDVPEVQVTFAFPGEIIESRSGVIDGNTVTYNDVFELSEGVDIQAEAAGGFPWLIVVLVVLVLGFFLLLVLAVAAFLFFRARKNKAGGAGGGPAAPAAFAGAAGAAGAAPPAGQGWGQPSPPPAPPQGDQGQPWGQPPGQPGQGEGQPWGQPSPPPAPPQGDQGQPWSQPPGQPGDPQQPGPGPQGGNQPPQNNGW